MLTSGSHWRASSSWVARASVSSWKRAREGLHRFAVVDGGAGDRHPLLQLQQLVGREGDGEAIEQVVAHRPLLGVVGGDQQAAAGVAEAQPLPLDAGFRRCPPPPAAGW